MLALDDCTLCLGSDHYLHQHCKSGPTGSTWLGGVATYTTIKDQGTELVFFQIVSELDASLGFSIDFGVCFLVIYVPLISCFEIVSYGSSFLSTAMLLPFMFFL